MLDWGGGGNATPPHNKFYRSLIRFVFAIKIYYELVFKILKWQDFFYCK